MAEDYEKFFRVTKVIKPCYCCLQRTNILLVNYRPTGEEAFVMPMCADCAHYYKMPYAVETFEELDDEPSHNPPDRDYNND